MNLKTLSMMGALLLLAGTGANAQKKKEVLNDSNTPHFPIITLKERENLRSVV